MDIGRSPYRVHQCHKCLGDTEYYCISCPYDLCSQCKEKHVKYLKTIDHDVVSYRVQFNYIPTQENCARHPSNFYIKYCEPCKLPVCYHCTEHRNHSQIDVRTAFETKQQQHQETIHSIRSDALFYRPVLLHRIKADFKICQTQFSLYQSETIKKAKKLNDFIFIDKVLYDLLNNVFCDFDFKHRCLKQKIEMNRHTVRLQRYLHKYEQTKFTTGALQFLFFIKTVLPQIHPILHISHLSMNESLNMEDVIESLSAIQITERGNRCVGNEYLLKLVSGAEFHQSLTLTDVDRCCHISCVISNRVWVSDANNLMLTDTTGVPLHRVEDLCSDLYKGLHTVNRENELIYVDRSYNINKLSNDMQTTHTLLNISDSSWRTLSVFCSPSTGDLLVGTYRKKSRTGHIIRRSLSGQLALIVQLYSEPRYLTENNNGDVVVSDRSTVVVTERDGRHRFSYTGPPSRSRLLTRGICTDSLSHILVCDGITNTVQMLDKDGQFLSHLLIRPSGIFRPHGISYDVNTHRLWVGSLDNNTVVIYRYITRQDALTDLRTADVMDSSSEIKTTETEKPQQGNQCLLKLISPPELLPSLTLTNVDSCYHISCVTSEGVWVSDGKNNLIFTDTTGVPLHYVLDLCKNIYGLHTVNSESELIYINRNYNIYKMSKDVKTRTTFIGRTDFPWEPRCVYWSPSTGDLLVAMCRRKPWKCKITRYNHNGQLIQTVQYDNTGLELYSRPLYITDNNNGDVVVSDFTAVVVTEREGRHRFTYTGHPPGSGLEPHGICTDALSHILVCDESTKTVQMLDRDGQFLSHLLTQSQKIGEPCGLSYDVTSHRLLVGSWDTNTVVICRYITKQAALPDKHTSCPDWDIFPAQHQP